MYEGLKSDFASDWSLIADLDSAKEKLKSFYQLKYANHTRHSSLQSSQSTSSISSRIGSSHGSPEKVNFTARYKKMDRVVVDELEEYFKLPREDFDSCKPLQWWLGRRSQFPNLYCLVCDVFSIPGEIFFMISAAVCLIFPSSRFCRCSRAYIFGRTRHNLFKAGKFSARHY
jgi:hypothetical protein